MSLVASLCMTLIPGLGYGAHRPTADPEAARLSGLEAQHDITVHEDQLSVHLQDADVGDVLTVIGQQAGITIVGALPFGIRVSTQFRGMPLDAGLRRLLRLASLSSSMVYANGPTGMVVLTAVHVFKEMPVPRSPIAAGAGAEDRREEAGQPFADALAQLSSASPPAEVETNDGTAHVRALLESAQHHAPPPGAGEESELARHFREVLEQTLQSSDETSPLELLQMEYEE